MAGTLTNARTIRIEPPMVIAYPQLDAVLNRAEDAVADVAAGRPAHYQPDGAAASINEPRL